MTEDEMMYTEGGAWAIFAATIAVTILKFTYDEAKEDAKACVRKYGKTKARNWISSAWSAIMFCGGIACGSAYIAGFNAQLNRE
ncbi:MAG: hypothetical protein LBG82_07300 [Clostridiales Family XIII bacterium]|nr:hypothetical protein [Clostridiales Family XIII bacterium]